MVLAAILGMLALILDAQTALNGAKEAVLLCLNVVVPSLFPFFFLSALLVAALSGARSQVLRPLGRLSRMPEGSEGLLLLGLLGGYPSGAQAVTQAWRGGMLSRRQARRLLGFCSNAGPAFLFGIVARQFTSPAAAWVLWGIHMLSSLAVGVLLPGEPQGHVQLARERITLTGALDRALKTAARVCGWVIVFRIVLAFAEKWLLWPLPQVWRVAIMGFAELTYGCTQLGQITSEPLRMCVCSAMLALGGVCVTMQTASVTGALGLGMYIPGKLLQCALSVALCALYLWGLPGWILAGIFAVGIAVAKKRVDFSRKLWYSNRKSSAESEGYAVS